MPRAPDVPRALDAHVRQVLPALDDWTPESERPADLLATSALLGVGAPGNIAWRALNRLRRADDRVTELGRWRAAAILASGLRSLFARPDAMQLLDSVYASSDGTREDDGAYWRRVAHYCIDGGLQAVLDEYVHHLAGESGVDTTTDEGLISLAATARRAIGLRESVYRATDIDRFDGEGIAFPSRYALRFGSTRHTPDEARLPEVRAAFNSPFWPFVLATTSVGQEGIDFHWWCHSIVHWNLPANPVDFEQREGRVDRYKGHAIRKNVAAAHRSAALAPGVTDPWMAVFEAAAAEDDHGLGDLTPCWIYPGAARLQRRIMALPLSRNEERWARLQESLALYRLAFGQPRQEDMLAALQRRGIAGQPERIADIRIDLRPPARKRSPEGLCREGLGAWDGVPNGLQHRPAARSRCARRSRTAPTAARRQRLRSRATKLLNRVFLRRPRPDPRVASSERHALTSCRAARHGQRVRSPGVTAMTSLMASDRGTRSGHRAS